MRELLGTADCCHDYKPDALLVAYGTDALTEAVQYLTIA